MTTTVEPPPVAYARECRTAARRDGVVPALRHLNAALSPAAPPRGPTGHALLPSDTAPVPGGAGTAPGLTLSAPTPGAGPSAAWLLGLAWLRLGASERLRDQTVARLANRQTEGTPLLMKQLVKVALADALTEHLEAECVLAELAEEEAARTAGQGAQHAPGAGGGASSGEQPGDGYDQARHLDGRTESAASQARYGPGAAGGGPSGAAVEARPGRMRDDAPGALHTGGEASGAAARAACHDGAVRPAGGAAGGWLGHVHERITRADRVLLRLLGAYGFVVPGPGWDAHLSEVLADVYRQGPGVTSEEA